MEMEMREMKEKLWVVCKGNDYGGTVPVAVCSDSEKAKERAKEMIPENRNYEETDREDGSYLARWNGQDIVETKRVEYEE